MIVNISNPEPKAALSRCTCVGCKKNTEEFLNGTNVKGKASYDSYLWVTPGCWLVVKASSSRSDADCDQVTEQ